MKHNKENTTIFIKREDDTYHFLVATQLIDIRDAVLPDGNLPGHCTIQLETAEKAEVDFLYHNPVELMIRAVEYGRYSNPDNGNLLCWVILDGDAKISYHSNNNYCWKLFTDAKIIEWG